MCMLYVLVSVHVFVCMLVFVCVIVCLCVYVCVYAGCCPPGYPSSPPTGGVTVDRYRLSVRIELSLLKITVLCFDGV